MKAKPSILERILSLGATEKRRQDTSWDFLGRGIGLDPAIPPASASGVLSASSVAVRCVQLRSELLASVPLRLYRKSADGEREPVDSPLALALDDQANAVQSAFEAREYWTRCLDLSGNAYARIERDGQGQVIGLLPIDPAWVSIERLSSGLPRYRVSDPNAGSAVLLSDQILHIRMPGWDLLKGVSVLSYARTSLGLAISQTEQAARLAASGFSSSGFLETGQVLNAEDRERLQQIMSDYMSGHGASKLMILEAGMKFNKMAFSPEDAEFLESRRLSDEAVARIFAVPPSVAGITNASTYNNIESEGVALVRNGLAPLAKRIEAAMMRCLLTAEERREGLFVEHQLQGLLRGDVAARFGAYRIGREIGVYSANEIRAFENLGPVEGGDTYLQPLNLAPLGSPAAPHNPSPPA